VEDVSGLRLAGELDFSQTVPRRSSPSSSPNEVKEEREETSGGLKKDFWKVYPTALSTAGLLARLTSSKGGIN
jgi:hypothetical protein